VKKKYLVFPLSAILLSISMGCHKKEAPPPPPPPPPVVEKKPEVKVDSTAIKARMRAEALSRAKSAVGQSTVYFDYDKSEIRDEYRSALYTVVENMKKFSEIRIQVDGHCDERGTAAYNLALGERRANAAKKFLSDAGISGSRIETKSWGEEKPATEGHNDAAWAKNRRDDFKVIN
jgi:peptidoglycan-associated lipoprotein